MEINADKFLKLKALEMGIDLFKYMNTTYMDDEEFAHLVNDPIENAHMFYEFLTDTEETFEGEI